MWAEKWTIMQEASGSSTANDKQPLDHIIKD